MTEAGELREAVESLQHENERLRTEAAHARRVLRSLEALLRTDIEENPFAGIFDALRRAISFAQIMVLVETGPDRLTCIVAEPSRLAGSVWPVGRFFSAILGGRVSAIAGNGDLGEWRDIRSGLLSPEQPALYAPLRASRNRGILVLLRAAGSHPFDRHDLARARQYALLPGHALARIAARRLILMNRARAIAAEGVNRSRNLFVAKMSHELRTPLNAIIGFSEFIGSEAYGPLGSPRYAEYVSDIHASGNHLLGIVNNLLLFSKIEAGQHTARLDDLSLRDELAYVERMLQFDAERYQVRLVCDRPGEEALVRADQQSLRQILINVIGNAIKFSPPEEIVRVEHGLGADGTTHTLRVVDHGCGIPSKTLAQLGNPFVQSDRSFSRRYQGSGLGLAICFGLAEAMGATIAIESEEGAGTAVTIGVLSAEPRSDAIACREERRAEIA